MTSTKSFLKRFSLISLTLLVHCVCLIHCQTSENEVSLKISSPSVESTSDESRYTDDEATTSVNEYSSEYTTAFSSQTETTSKYEQDTTENKPIAHTTAETPLPDGVTEELIYVGPIPNSNSNSTENSTDTEKPTAFENLISSTSLPPTTTTEVMVTANSSRCPIVIITPQLVSTDFATTAQFKAVVGSYYDEALESRWIKQGLSASETIDITNTKYFGSKNLPAPELNINYVTFDDEVSYELQVRIIGGWCFGNTVSLDVRGILQFYDPCNHTKECDQRENLVCSPVYNSCMCNSNYYHSNRTCYHKSNLTASMYSSNITTSSITVWWDHPHWDADLVQSYNVSLRAVDGSYNLETSVDLQTNYTFVSSFPPSYLYYFEIASIVLLSDPEEKIVVQSTTNNLVVEPEPPGPINTNNSVLNPQSLRLSWAKSDNSTYVNMYEIRIDNHLGRSSSNSITMSLNLEPGSNYTMQIVAICWFHNNFSKRSSIYYDLIQTRRVPKVTIPGWVHYIPLLSSFEINATVESDAGFPQTTSTKWQRLHQDINITDPKFLGSSEDLVTPKLVVNRVDFDNDHWKFYRCIASNSEGSWISNMIWTYLYGSLNFLENCTRNEECTPGKSLTCKQRKCLCHSSYYHKNLTCYNKNNLRVRFSVNTDRCEANLKWNHPSVDFNLITDYIAIRESLQNNLFISEEMLSVGLVTQYSTTCILQPGRLYRFRVRSNISLTDPSETTFIDSHSREKIMEPLPPGNLDRKMSNFSANNLILIWSPPGENTFLNHYKVIINGNEQQTYGSVPKIYWNKKLTPGTIYNVTITAVSYGDISSGPWNGIKESVPYIDWFETDTGNVDGYSFLPFGERDIILRGDDVTTPPLKSPTTIYAGDGTDGGFDFVQIGSNGVIGLGEDFNSISVHEINTGLLKKKRIICPFWTDMLTVDTMGNVYYKTYQRGVDAENDLFLEKANSIVRLQFGDFSEFEASWVVKATWENMTLFGDKSKTVTFQCLLITDGPSTFTVFIFIDVDLKLIKNKKISIGYQYVKNFEKNSFSNKPAAFKMSKIPGNRGMSGFWIYKMTTGIPLNKDEKECFDWYIKNKEQNTYNKLSSVLNEIRCPCNNILLRFDPRYAISRFDRFNRVLCFASMLVGRNAECCYRMHSSVNLNDLGALERSLPSAGTLLQYNPFFEQRPYTTEDFRPRQACCVKSKHCDWFYDVRPIPWCYLRSPFNPALNFGDPHIVTLDGKNYTFNGYGEYTMLNITKEKIQFDFQARTDLATTANGTRINATIFSAFVAQDQTGSKVQVEMSRDKKRMIIRVNEREMTREFENTSFVWLTRNLSVRWENSTLSASFLQASIILKVSLGVRFLISEVVVDTVYQGHAKGLMGDFDGNATNDFLLPNGTRLDDNVTRTERDIYYNFGQMWLVSENSLFHYDRDLTYQNFTYPDFLPIFLDEFDKKKLENARSKCGSNPSQACIFDFLATGDIALAESSGNEETVAHSDKRIIENESPSITGNKSINVEVGKPVQMYFNASDDSNKKPTYNVLKQPDGFVLNETSDIATWTPTNTNVSEISISVVDDIGAESPALDVTIVLCSGCSNNGRCDFDNMIQTDNAQYSLAGCACEVGYSGINCELDTDGCLNEPCPLLRHCTDLTPEEEKRLGRANNCSGCPDGYKDINNKCEDINECKENSTNVCDIQSQICENTEGSYTCNCKPGFRKLQTNCEDIDECFEKTSGCEQICNNTLGSFECQCLSGFSLDTDKTTCERTGENTCDNVGKNCSYTCDPITQECLCPIGYELAEDGQSCKDVNECENSHLCEHNCTNTNGSFYCHCRSGYILQQDKISCSECEEPTFGENCSQVCTCGQGMDRCDHVTGCVCKSGWTGANCTEDINECEIESSMCGPDKVCQNLEGSYQCNCKEGFMINENTCQDIDECSDVTLNNCLENTECQNLFGNYTCNCKAGFQRHGSACEDVDECESGVADCEQICINAIGGFNCECEFGYALDDINRKTCEEVTNVCDLFPELNCSYGCRNERTANVNKGSCFCRSGYKLDLDNSTCLDIDECQELEPSVCEQNCTNMKGSFQCSCTTGYFLENDGKTCKECTEGLFGENCQQQCRCGRGSERCDHVQGCVCRPGWTGTACDTDINECDDNEYLCNDTFENCTNNEGSFQCDCQDGFERAANGSCNDVDECALNTDSCDAYADCTNTLGNFICKCYIGFSGDGYSCTACNITQHGENCSSQCTCVEGTTVDCNDVTGACDCKPTWNGTNCGVDVNECDLGTHDCNSTLEICENIDGGWNCTCRYGALNEACNEMATTTMLEITTSMTKSTEETTKSTETSTETTLAFSQNTEETTESSVTPTETTQSTVENTEETTQSTEVSTETTQSTTQYTKETTQSTETSTETTQSVTQSTEETTQSTGKSSETTEPITQKTEETTQSTETSTGTTLSLSQSTEETPQSSKTSTETTQSTTQHTDETTQSTKTSIETTQSITQSTIETTQSSEIPTETTLSTTQHTEETAQSTVASIETTQSITQSTVETAQSTVTSSKSTQSTAKNTKETTPNTEISPETTLSITQTTAETTPNTQSFKSTSASSQISLTTTTEGSESTTQAACDDTHYGIGCTRACPCDFTNTMDCNDKNGTCHCKPGWTGTTCGDDVNECTSNTHDCNNTVQSCNNIDGGFDCVCLYGSSNTGCIVKETTYVPQSTEVKLGVTVTLKNNIALDDYNTVKQEMTTSLNDFYSKKIPGFVKVIILLIRKGSTIVEHEVVVRKTDQANQDLVTSVLSLSSGESNILYDEKPLNSSSVAVSDKSGNPIVITSSSSKCDLYVINNPCDENEKCIEDSSRAYCTKLLDSSNNFKIIIGLGVGISLFGIVVFIGIIISYSVRRKRRLKKEPLSSSNDNFESTYDGQGMHFTSGMPTRIDSWGRYGSPYSPHWSGQDGKRGMGNTDISARKHYTYDDGAQSIGSLGFMYQALQPNKKFQIKRPEVSKKPFNTQS